MNDHIIELSKSTKEEERHMVTTRKELIECGIHSLFSKDQYDKPLEPLQCDILDYRYIVSSCKDEVKNIKSKLSGNNHKQLSTIVSHKNSTHRIT